MKQTMIFPTPVGVQGLLLRLWPLLLLWQCSAPAEERLFTRLSKSDTGIDFRNLIVEKESFSIFKYQYFYNGGGVAIADFNNDGLQDVVFTGNMVKNRLYLNKGNLQFEDITTSAGIADKEGWCTGAVPVDINHDGWLDLYICRAGYPFDHLRYNLLFINNGGARPTFTEKSAEYGLNDLGHATQASFFDYDLDGDLDLFILNHSTVDYSRGSLEVLPLRQKHNPAFTNKLLRNDQGKYTDVTESAGIYSNVLTFSLGIHITDVNTDGWPDIFIGNDFNEPDYLFINQQNGTFQDEIKTRLDHTSMFTMGTDFADYNNDGLTDFVSLDMLPESNRLQKLHAGVDNFDKVNLLANAGLLRQYSRNMLQRNNGDGTFTEIAQMAGVSNTDWSWSPLFFDFDNDGWKDLFISNGYLRDHTDMDFLKFTADEVLKMQQGKDAITFEQYLEKMPPISQPNYFYQNLKDGYRFADRTRDWSDAEPGVSQGAAYADLDNDGDLDMVVNNSNDVASVYRNNSERLFPDHHALRLRLRGPAGNPWGIGAVVRAWAGEQQFYLEQNPVRGFQTSVDPVLHLGLGTLERLDSLRITWPGGATQILNNVAASGVLDLDAAKASGVVFGKKTPASPLFQEKKDIATFEHRENLYNDFKTQLLLPYFYSRPGPALAAADVNADGRVDVFAGGAKGQSSVLCLQQADGKYRPAADQPWSADAEAEAVDACFLDADSDGDQDLLVAGGAYEETMPNRLYLQQNGRWTKAVDHPFAGLSSACVRATRAGEQTLVFLGAGIRPGRFPEKNGNDAVIVLQNGKAPAFVNLVFPGISTDACWVQLCGDAMPDLVVAVEWGSPVVLEYQAGQMLPRPDMLPAKGVQGLWQSVQAADLDQDGDQDLVLGNLGLNSQLKATESLPLDLYAGDFDANGSVDPLLFYGVQGKSYAFAAMEDLWGQVPPMKKKFIYFKDYAEAGVQEILNENQLKNARHFSADQLASVVLINQGQVFVPKILPDAAQVAPVCALALADFNHDGHTDILTAGNMQQVKVKLGDLSGNHGVLLLGDGAGGFRVLPKSATGLHLRGEVRNLLWLPSGNGGRLWAGVNNGPLRIFEIQ